MLAAMSDAPAAVPSGTKRLAPSPLDSASPSPSACLADTPTPGAVEAESAQSRKRRRSVRAPQKYDPLLPSEEISMRHAIANSKLVTKRPTKVQLTEAPVYRPSLEEFQDPLAFIQRCVRGPGLRGSCTTMLLPSV